jgi:hypothetical protein
MRWTKGLHVHVSLKMVVWRGTLGMGRGVPECRAVEF